MRILLVFVFAFFAAAVAEASFGAIAYSPITGRVGNAWGWNTQHEAMNSAMGYCNTSDCRVVVWVNNACGSLAVSHNNTQRYASAWALNRAEAEVMALNACGFNCYNRAWVCSF